uniref:Uncharacterized protein n=1 Tax=Cacopsylla melanoneura TaxID=428564 RepID=A0A8D9DQW5_9HEMI
MTVKLSTYSIGKTQSCFLTRSHEFDSRPGRTFFSKRKVLTQNGRLSPFFLLVAFRDRNTYLSSLVASSQQLKHVEYSDSFLIAQVKQRPTIAHVVYLDRYLLYPCDAGFSRPHPNFSDVNLRGWLV